MRVNVPLGLARAAKQAVFPASIRNRSANAADAASGSLGTGQLGALLQKGRCYHFASSRFAEAVGRLPAFDGTKLRTATIKYIETFDPSEWTTDPMCTVVEGVAYAKGESVETRDARGRVNGRQIIGDDDAFSAVMSLARYHTAQASSGKLGRHRRDEYREAVRRMESVLLSDDIASKLVGNQAMDFGKQDGITEIEESVQANEVERRMNDQLSTDESLGHVEVLRHPALVACVSNFSNFLDLFRKTVRNIELGVPVIVLSRSNTSQHCYRWFQLLSEQMTAHGLPSHLVTFASLSVDQQRRLMRALPASPCYFTGSRHVARLIKQVSPRLMASTGGPNTMLATELSPQIAEAVRMSACIENSGQCTALRHLVAPPMPDGWLEKDVFGPVAVVGDAVQSLEHIGFFDLLEGMGDSQSKPGYKTHPSLPISYRTSDKLPIGIQENWRQVYLDVTARSDKELSSDGFTKELCEWLVKEQPISLAVNGPVQLALRMWENTGLAVFSWGTKTQPALSCQARPQDGECFGEFPPRKYLTSHTRFPVIVPSPTPAYNSIYNVGHLETQSLAPCPDSLSFCRPLLDLVEEKAAKGFCIQLLAFLADAATGPKRGHGARTCLYGLQRSPLDGRRTAIFCGKDATMADLAPLLLPFYATNARSDVHVIVAKENTTLLSLISKIDTTGLHHTIGDEAPPLEDDSFYNVISTSKMLEFPLVGQFMSLLLPIGHCKSVRSGDDEFLAAFTKSKKWLRVLSKPGG